MTETQLDLDYLRSETSALAHMAYTYGKLDRSEVVWLVNVITDLIAEVERLSA